MKILLLLSQFLILCKGIDILRVPKENPQPNPRKSIVMNGIFSHNYFIFFGGFYSQDSLYNDIWNYNMTDYTWNQMFSTDGIDPGIFYLVARYAGAGYWNYLTDEYCIWGGMSVRGQLNDLWCFHLTSYTWRRIETSGNLIKPRYRIGYVSWNESSTVMLAIVGGLTIEHASFDMYIMNTTSAVIQKQVYAGDLPGAQDSPNLFYNGGYLYLVGGISPYDTNPYAPKFFRYNRTEQQWENITNNDHIFKFRSNYQGRINNNILYLFPGLDSTSYSIESSVWAVNLTDPANNKYEWYEVTIQDDPDGVLLRNSYAITRFEDQLYMFGGVVGSETRNDFITFNLSTKNPMQFVYHPSWSSPSPREYHSLALVGSAYYLFGGDQIGTKLSDLWKMNMDTYEWELVSPRGEIPEARSHHAYAAFGDVMIIWGGEGSNGYLNNGYLFNSLTNLWKKIESNSTVVPSPRIGTCLDVMNSEIIMYGGKTTIGLSSEMWLFDLGTSTYTLLDSDNNDGPGALYLTSCRFSTDHPYTYYVLMGVGENDVPSNGFYTFKYNTYKWSKTYRGPSNALYDRGDTRAFKIRSRYIYVGGAINNTPTNTLTYLNTSSIEFDNFGYLPEYAYAGAQAQFGQYFITHGGGSTIGPNLRRTIPNGNAFVIDLFSDCKANDTCMWFCTPGSYLYNNSCVPCQPGTYQPYFDTRQCIPCPHGTYYGGYAAVSIVQCIPCAEYYFNIDEGAAYCWKCPENSYCPLGSYNYTFSFPNFTAKSVQPNLWSAGKKSNTDSIIAEALIGGVGLIVLVVFGATAHRNNWLIALDSYTAKHNHDLDVPMILTKNKLGGFFSVVFYVLALIIIVNPLILYAEDNIVESKSLVPLVVMDTKVSEFKTELNVTVTVLNYGADCVDSYGKCKDIGYSSENIIGSWSNMQCWNVSKDCTVNLYCANCIVNPGAMLNYEFMNKTSYSSGFTVNASTSSSIPSSISSYEVTALPGDNKLYRGSDPTVVYFDLTPSYFENTDSGLDLTGYHISVIKSSLNGSQYDPDELIVSYNLYFKVSLGRNSNCLVTIRSAKQSLITLISLLLGSVFGLMGSIGGAMSFVETQYVKGKRKKQFIEFKEGVKKTGFYLGGLFSSMIQGAERDNDECEVDDKLLDPYPGI